jgi:serine protease Do
LINLAGEVIGINTAIVSRSGTSSGIGFAIPSNTVRMALEGLLKKGRIIRGYLGIETTGVRPGQVTARNDSGVPVVAVMPNSPAAEAKIQRGDVIQKFDGHEIHNIVELRRLVSQTELDKKVDVEVKRGGKEVTLSTKLKEQPANYQLARSGPPNEPGQEQPSSPDQSDADQPNQSSGGTALDSMEVRDLTPQLAQRLGVPPGVRGVVVTQVGSDIAGGQIRAGDVIEAINQEPVNSVQDYQQAIRSLDADQPQVLSVCRQRTRSFVVVQPR